MSINASEDIQSEHAKAFLLTQFSEMNQDWRHLDKRIETTINLYISVFTVIVAAAAIVYSDKTDWWLLLKFAAYSAFILIPLGFYVTRRVKNAAIARDRRQLSMNLIKVFFQERHSEIGPYLPVYVSTPVPLKGDSDKMKRESENLQSHPSPPYGVIWTIYVFDGVLAGIALIGFSENSSRVGIFYAVLATIATITIHRGIEKKWISKVLGSIK